MHDALVSLLSSRLLFAALANSGRWSQPVDPTLSLLDISPAEPSTSTSSV